MASTPAVSSSSCSKDAPRLPVFVLGKYGRTDCNTVYWYSGDATASEEGKGIDAGVVPVVLAVQ